VFVRLQRSCTSYGQNHGRCGGDGYYIAPSKELHLLRAESLSPYWIDVELDRPFKGAAPLTGRITPSSERKHNTLDPSKELHLLRAESRLTNLFRPKYSGPSKELHLLRAESLKSHEAAQLPQGFKGAAPLTGRITRVRRKIAALPEASKELHLLRAESPKI